MSESDQESKNLSTLFTCHSDTCLGTVESERKLFVVEVTDHNLISSSVGVDQWGRGEMALELLRSAKTILKIDDLTIDNIVFKLHYRVTVAILIGSSLIGVAKQYFGDPINCQTSSGVSSKVMIMYWEICIENMNMNRFLMTTAGSTAPSMWGMNTK